MSEILKALRFIQGGVSKKDNVPYQSHVAIDGGKIRSQNGTVSLCSPIPIDLNCQPKALPFIKVIAECKDVPAIKLMANGKLDVKAGKLRVKIDCTSDVMPYTVPSGTLYECDGALILSAVKKMIPFVTTDNKRMWARGMLFTKGLVCATNNVVLIQYWTNSVFAQDVTIPLTCLEEIVRIGEPPKHVQISDTSITFHYEGDRWLHSVLISEKWPDLEPFFTAQSTQVAIPDELWTALKAVKSFAPDKAVTFGKGKISTENSEYEVENFDGYGVWGVDFMSMLEGVAKTIDFKLHPKPAPFFGENLRGAIVGHSV